MGADPATRGHTLPEMARARADDDPGHVALVVDGREELTLGEWHRRAAGVAHGLLARGVGPGDRVALLPAPTGWIDYLVGNLAIYLAGGTVVGMEPGLPAAEFGRRLRQCGVVGVLHSDGVRPPAAAGWSATVRGLDGGVPTPPSVDLDPAAPAEILYTSGTTGPAKAIAVSHGNLTFGRDPRGQLFGDGDTILAGVSIGTNAGHSATLLALMTRCTVHVTARLEPDTVAGLIEGLRPRMAVLPPPLATRMVAYGHLDRYDLSSLRTVMLGSAPLPVATATRFCRAVPEAGLLSGYGSTESAPAFLSRRVAPWAGHQDPAVFTDGGGLVPLGTAGGDSEVLIADADGHPVPIGELGEICLRSPAPARWYLEDADRTADVFGAGWTRMGDVGRIDAAGVVSFFDRAADVIPVGGARVSSARVENALFWHPAVADAAAYGVGGAVLAAVELVRPVPPAELREVAARRLEPHEVPAAVEVVDALPHSAIGKPMKRALRARRPVPL